ncbi:MAG: hypothetical protein CMJ94_12900 [Planctomycetes bacterium]|nr:hypothetical protein [Planctomycetota bacterium]
MINHLIAWSLRRRFAVLLASLALLVYGGYTAWKMPVDVFPDLTAPTVTIIVEGHGMAPEEMESLVTFPVETAVNGATDVRRVRSATAVGIAVIWVEFEWGTEIHRARQTVNERLATVANSLPEQVEAPVLAPISSMMGEILFVGLTSDDDDGLKLREVADLQIRRRLLAVEGVSLVTPIGGDVRQYQVILAPQRLRALGVTRAQVAEALRSNNENVSAGFLLEGGTETLLRGIGRYETLEQIASTVVDRSEQRSITVEDLGIVTMGAAIKRGTAAVTTRDEEGASKVQPGVVLAIQKQPSANTLALTRTLDQVLDEMQPTLPEGMQIHKNLFRQSDFIEHSISNTTAALVEGALFVVVIVVLFLASLQASVITLLAMPISLLVAVLVMSLFGVSINTMTLGGMAIAIGSLVDDAIIDVENVVRRLRENRTRPKEQRLSSLRVIYLASAEVRTSIVLATCIILLVFAPLFFLTGVEGRLLVPLGLAFCVSLAASLLTALTLTPALCAVLLPRSKTIRTAHEPAVIRLLKRSYAGPLAFAMRHPWMVLAPTLIAFVLAVVTAGRMGKNFLPEFNEGALVVGLVSLPGTSLEQSDFLAVLAEDRLAQFPEVVAMARRTGRAEADEHVQGVESSEIEMMLDMDAPLAQGLPKRSKGELLDAMRQELAGVPGLEATFGQPISHRVDHMLSGTRANLAIKIFGEDLATLRTLAAQVEAELGRIPGVVDLSTEQQVEIGQLRVEFDRAALARFGIPLAEAARALETAYQGEVVGQIFKGRQTYDLSLRLADGEGARRDALEDILLDTPDGAKVPLGVLARMVDDRGPNVIMREDVQRKIVVMCNVADRAMTEVVADARTAIEERVPMPPGYFVQYGGQFETATAANQRLAVLGALAILGIALLLGSMFRSVREVLLIMLNLPLALIGGVAGVALSGGVISIASIIGFVSVFGIAARNGIMLVSHVRHLQEEEGVEDFVEAVRRGAMERLAPILMTALSAGLALIPLALRGDDPGTEILTPMAIVILFGLISSTFLNMVVVPALFVRIGRPVREIPDPERPTGGEGTPQPGLAVALLLVSGVVLGSCAQVAPEEDYRRTAAALQEASGRADWASPTEKALDAEAIEALFAEGLSMEEALQITLQAQPRLRARYLEVGVAHAEFVQAKLLANPFFDFAARFPSGGGGTVLEAILGFELLDLWQAPRRRAWAERQLDATVLQIAWEASAALDQTRHAYLQVVTADVALALEQELATHARAQQELVEQRRQAGAADLAAVQRAALETSEAELAVQSAALAATRARSELGKALGWSGSLDGIALQDDTFGAWLVALQEDSALAFSEEGLRQDLAGRLDLRALRQSVEALEARLAWEEARVFPRASAGLNFERSGGVKELGPALSVQLPVFDRNQAQIARAELLLEQARLLEQAACADAAQDLRLAWQRFEQDRRALVDTGRTLHEAARGVEQSVEEARQIGAATQMDVLRARADRLRVERTMLQLRAEFALAASALERERGRPLLVVPETSE